MNRKEAIEILTKTAEELKFLIADYLLSRSTKMQYIDLIDAVEKLSEPVTLVDLLGWEEETVYELKGRKFIISSDNTLYELLNDDWGWYQCNFDINKHKKLQQAKQLEDQSQKDKILDDLKRIARLSERMRDKVKKKRRVMSNE